jgi:very-short-patch-repair endonuclease
MQTFQCLTLPHPCPLPKERENHRPIVLRPVTDLAVRSYPKYWPGKGMSSPGGEETGEGELKTDSLLAIISSIFQSMASTAQARQFRQRETWAEKLMWRWLRDRRFNFYKFRRQYLIGDYYIDFYCKEAELAIELDGGRHGYPDQQAHDAKREKFLKSQGIKTLRFWNSHLRRNSQSIRDTIFNELQKTPHIHCQNIPNQ